MFLFSFGEDKKTWNFGEAPLPVTVFQFGAPKEVRVSNVIVEAGLEQICNVCGIKLRRVKRLKGLDEFKQSMYRFHLQ